MSDRDGGRDAAKDLARSGDGILDRLFRTERPRLMRYVYRRVGRQEDAQDLLQDAFASLSDSLLATLSGAPEAYLRRVVHNLLYDWFRNKHVRRAELHVPIDEALTVGTPPDQETGLDEEDARQRYIAALDLLPHKTREIFLLSRVDGLPYAEIAKRMGLSVKSIEYHMTKALAHLHHIFYGE